MRIRDIILTDKNIKAEEGTVPYIEIGDINTETKTYQIKEKGSVSGAVMAQAGCLLVSTVRPTRGAISILLDDAAVSSAFVILKTNESLYRLKFLFYVINCSRFFQYLGANSKGATYPTCSKDVVLDYSIPEYEISEQDTIVAQFDALSSIIMQRMNELQILDNLIKARFAEMFGDPELNPMDWPTDNLGKLLSVEPQNGLYKPQSDYVQDGTGTPILRIDAFYDGKVTSFCELKRLNCTDSEKHRYLLHENDIVINRVNSIEYLGKCAWISGMREPTVFESNMMRFHTDESLIDPCYLTRLLCSTYIYNQILNRAKKAVNQASINQGDVQSFKILIPPINLQRQFAAFVSQVDKSKSVVQKALNEARLLFDSLMQKYFG